MLNKYNLYLDSCLQGVKQSDMGDRTECKISANGKKLEQENEMVYLGSMFSRDGRYERDVEKAYCCR